MKAQLVVVSGPSPSQGGAPAWEEVLAELGPTRPVMSQAWLVVTSATENEVLVRVRACCDDDVELVVVRLDLGGYAAHLRTGEALSRWWGQAVADSQVAV